MTLLDGADVVFKVQRDNYSPWLVGGDLTLAGNLIVEFPELPDWGATTLFEDFKSISVRITLRYGFAEGW